MKPLQSILIALSVLTFTGQVNAQSDEPIERVSIEQGRLIGSLPYGKHFYLTGNAKVRNDKPVSRVTVEIWNTGRIQYRRNKRLIVPLQYTAADIAAIKSESTLAATAAWRSDLEADDPDIYELYISNPLQVRTQYLVILDYFQDIILELKPEEKKAIMAGYLKKTLRTFEDEGGGISATSLREMLTEDVRVALSKKIAASDVSEVNTSEFKFVYPVITESTLDRLQRLLGGITSSEAVIRSNEKTIRNEIQPYLDTVEKNSVDWKEANQQKRELEEENLRRKTENLSDRVRAAELLEIVSNQEILVKTTVVSSNTEVSVPQLDAINLGTAFGSGIVGMNVNNSNAADFDVLSYSALKFYFMPVDKRIHDPYIDKFLLGRLSFLLGVSFNSNLDYKGSELDDAIGFFPVMGFSYDFNRYFSLDLGATLFEQRPSNSLTSDKELRVGPIVGLTFDLDLLNRFRSTFKGDSYLINPN